MAIDSTTATDDPRIVAGLRAQAEQRGALLRAGAQRLGWKAGFGTAAALEKLGTSAPLVGHLTTATDVASGSTVSVAGWENPVLEHEVAFRLAEDLGPGSTRADALLAIGGIAPAIEIVDLGAADDVEVILRGNIFHRFVVLGPFTAPATDAAIDGVRVTAVEDGRVTVRDAVPAENLGDLVDVVRAIADQLPLADDALRAGDVLITGAAIPPTRLRGGERVEVRLGGGGSVAVVVEG